MIDRTFPLLAAGLFLLTVHGCSGDDAPASGADAGDDRTVGSSDADTADASDEGQSDGGGDASTRCVGNPLTADGVTPDGGAVVTATSVVDEKAARSGLTAWMVDGPRWLDLGPTSQPPGVFVYASSDYAGGGFQLYRVQGNGNGRALVRDFGDAGTAFGFGNATTGQDILTAPTKGAALLRTIADGGAGASVPTGAAADPHGVVVGPAGTLYVTDPELSSLGATTGVYRISSGGVVTAIATVAGAIRFSGLAITPSTRKLYVSLGAPSHREIWVFSVNADGSVSGEPNAPHTVLVGPGAPGGIGATDQFPAGLAVDEADNVWVAESPVDPTLGGKVEVFSPAGAKHGEIPFPGTRPTGIAYGGGKNDIVFVTSASGSNGAGAAGAYRLTTRCTGVR